jgi:hypothetical protein
MAEISGYKVLAFERKPGVWRISITSAVGDGLAGVQTRQSVRIFSEVDYASENKARAEALSIIRGLPINPLG